MWFRGLSGGLRCQGVSSGFSGFQKRFNVVYGDLKGCKRGFRAFSNVSRGFGGSGELKKSFSSSSGDFRKKLICER